MYRIILGIISVAAAGCSFIPVLPLWANIALKCVGVVVPVIGVIIEIVKFVKNRKKSIAPTNFVERSFTKNETLSEAEIEQILEDDYQDAVEESSKKARKHSKVYDSMNDELIDDDNKVNTAGLKRRPKTKRTNKSSLKSNFNDNLKGLDPDFRVPVYHCMEEILAN